MLSRASAGVREAEALFLLISNATTRRRRARHRLMRTPIRKRSVHANAIATAIARAKPCAMPFAAYGCVW